MPLLQTFLFAYYEPLSRYTYIPEIASALKDINEGINLSKNFPITEIDFFQRRNEIISFIINHRKNNVINSIKEKTFPLSLIPALGGTHLNELQPADLHYNLDFEICRLIIDAMHKIIKKKSPNTKDCEIVSDLFDDFSRALIKYHFT